MGSSSASSLPPNSLLFSTCDPTELNKVPLTLSLSPRRRTWPLPFVSPFNPPLSPRAPTEELVTSPIKTYGLEPSLSPLRTSSDQIGQTVAVLRSPDTCSKVILPVELTHLILWFLAFSEYSSPGFLSSMIPLRAVCSGWRTVIDNSFSFWKAVCYDDDRSKRHLQDFQHRILSLHSSESVFDQYLAPFNKHLFIKILDWDTCHDNVNLSLAVDLIPMCLHLKFTLPSSSAGPNMLTPQEMGYHRGGNVTVATLLSALHIHPDVRSFTWERDCDLTDSLPAAIIPKDQFSIPPSSNAIPIIPHHWPCMTTLTLDCRLSVAVCVDALNRFQDTLQSVTFGIIASNGEAITLPCRPFTLPCLSDMKIAISKPSINFGSLFTGAIFLAPALKYLRLETVPDRDKLNFFDDVDLHPGWISIAQLTLRDVSRTDGSKWIQTCSQLSAVTWMENQRRGRSPIQY